MGALPLPLTHMKSTSNEDIPLNSLEECKNAFYTLLQQVQTYQARVESLEQTVESLTSTVDRQGQHIQALEQERRSLSILSSSETADEMSMLPPEATESFCEFVRLHKDAEKRAEIEKQHKVLQQLKSIFDNMKALDALGRHNEEIFECMRLYIGLLQELQPAEETWTWTQWWSSTQSVTLTSMQEELRIRMEKEEDDRVCGYLITLNEIVQQILKEQEIHARTASSWTLYLSHAESDVNQVKDILTERLDKSGFEICKRLQQEIRDLGQDEPGQFIVDHCSALVKSSPEYTGEQTERIRQFADTFAMGEEWVMVESGTPESEDLDWLNWTMRKIRNSCSLYGYNSNVDHLIDTADNYKATCRHVKTTIEWMYFGGRLVVDPTGAVLSLLW